MATEKRLIDVNKVIDQMQKCIDESPYERDSIASYTFGAIIECLKKEPTADAVEVVHGLWIEEEIYDKIICDVCGHEWNILDNDTETFNYCPNCGAKMDGERKDND